VYVVGVLKMWDYDLILLLRELLFFPEKGKNGGK
jgi:hypothetical protein